MVFSMRKHFLGGISLVLLLFPALQAAAQVVPADYVWTSQSHNSSESMPVGGCDTGLNVWIEQGGLYFYVTRSGHFDENNSLLKAGRVRLKLGDGFADKGFEQRLRLSNGMMTVADGERQVTLWVDAWKPVVHVEVSMKKAQAVECCYESWRHHDRDFRPKENDQMSYKFTVPAGTKTRHDETEALGGQITFWHANPDSTIFDATVRQQRLVQWKHGLYDPLGRLVFGGRMLCAPLRYAGTYDTECDGTDSRGWRFVSRKPLRRLHATIALADRQGTVDEWRQLVDDTVAKIDPKRDRLRTAQWWKEWWGRSWIESASETAAVMTRNYTLFRYLLGCNARSPWPTKWNGGLFTFRPQLVGGQYAFTPDFRRWGGGTYVAQNQRLLYWPMLKSGDLDALRKSFDFYMRLLRTAETRSRAYWGHVGACFTEQMEQFGLPQYAEYAASLSGDYASGARPAGLNPGIQANVWLQYLWDTVLEFCQMALQAESYFGADITEYVPWICSSLDFFHEHYHQLARQLGVNELDGSGHLVLYPGSACETYKMTYNSSSTSAALRVVTDGLVDWLKKTGAAPAVIRRYKGYAAEWPPLAYRYIDGHKTISPAEVWGYVQNIETPQLYPVFPWHLYGVGLKDLKVARDTWRLDPQVVKWKEIQCWRQTGIFAADLGLTEEAAQLNAQKLADGPFRFPAFPASGYDWAPDMDWAGSGMIGLQEMLLQEAGGKIYLFPAWPRRWDVTFRLHCSQETTVEATLSGGRVTAFKVTPESRRADIVIGADTPLK